MRDLTYKTSSIPIFISAFESTDNVSVSIKDSHFSNITFEGGGSLVKVEAQMKEDIEFTSCSFRGINNGGVIF